jgi:hypothetical protein
MRIRGPGHQRARGFGRQSAATGIAAVAARNGEVGEQLGKALIEDGAIVAAGFVAESRGKPAFADAGRPA